MDALFLELRQALGRSPPQSLPPKAQSLRQSAVLVPLFARENEPYIVFTRRQDSLRDHGGQISFPGGMREPQDASFLQTALRETEEELGISPSRVEVLGALNEVHTITQFRILPFVGAIPSDLAYRANPAEVEAVLEVPIRKLLDPAIHRIERRRVLDEEHEIYFYQYDAHLIWGATARILRNLLELMAGLPALKPRPDA